MNETSEEDKALFDLIKRHSTNFLEMAFRTDYRERINSPDGYGRSSNRCGDIVEFFLIVRKDKISSVALDVNGCIKHQCLRQYGCVHGRRKKSKPGLENHPRKGERLSGNTPPT